MRTACIELFAEANYEFVDKLLQSLSKTIFFIVVLAIARCGNYLPQLEYLSVRE
ncbi:hypothetical protein D3C86_2044420 [compost metagenome]